jgi:hypothetical protein
MTKPIKFRKPSNYDVAVAKTGIPFTYQDDEGNSFGTFDISLFNTDSKFVRVSLERFGRENKEALDAIENVEQRGVFTFINTALHGWSNVKDADGKDVPFSRENAMAFFADDSEDDDGMFNAIVRFAQTKANFKHDPRATKDDEAKN